MNVGGSVSSQQKNQGQGSKKSGGQGKNATNNGQNQIDHQSSLANVLIGQTTGLNNIDQS